MDPIGSAICGTANPTVATEAERAAGGKQWLLDPKARTKRVPVYTASQIQISWSFLFRHADWQILELSF